MLLVKIKPLGWSIIFLILLCAGVVGFFLSRAPFHAANANAVADEPPAAFSKTALYPHIAATDPAVARALSAENLDGGEKLLDKEVTFLGHIVTIYTPASNSVHILNLAQKYKQALSVAIPEKVYAKFPDPQVLVGKQILVHGKLVLYNKHLEVMIDTLDQIHLVDGTKTTAATL